MTTGMSWIGGSSARDTIDPDSTSTLAKSCSTTTQLDSSIIRTARRRRSQRRRDRSTRRKEVSGRAIARGRPGRPTPDPRSVHVVPRSTPIAKSSESAMCRRQTRPRSCGPIPPALIASSASQLRYRCSMASWVGSRSKSAHAAALATYSALSATMFHVKHRAFPECHSGATTTDRFGSSPSEKERTPSISAIASCTTLRSAAFIGSSMASLPSALTFSASRPA